MYVQSYTQTRYIYEWPLGAENVQDLTSKVRCHLTRLTCHLTRLRCHVRRLRCHLRRLICYLRRVTLDVKSKTFFAPNGHLYTFTLNDQNANKQTKLSNIYDLFQANQPTNQLSSVVVYCLSLSPFFASEYNT